jgi:hypothetical protein
MLTNVPREFVEQGITTPQAAAEQMADTIGFHAIQVMDDRAKAAGQQGRKGEQAFYEEARDILIDRYSEQGED